MTPATAEQRAAMLGQMAAVLASRQASDTARKVRWDTYHKKLGHLPADILERAADHFIENEKWFPEIAEILKFSAPIYATRVRHNDRLKLLSKGAYSPPEQPLSPERRKQLANMLSRSVIHNPVDNVTRETEVG